MPGRASPWPAPSSDVKRCGLRELSVKDVNSGSRQADPISPEQAAPLFLVICVHVYAKYS